MGRPSSSTSEAESQNSATIAALAAKQHRHASQNNTHRQDEDEDVDEDVAAMEAMMEVEQEEASMVAPPPRANPLSVPPPPRPAAAAFRPATANGGSLASTAVVTRPSNAAAGRIVLPNEDLDALCAGVDFDEPDLFDDENVDVFGAAARRAPPAAAALQDRPVPAGPLTSTPRRVNGARSGAADVDELVIDDDVALVRSTRKAVVTAQAPPPKHAWTRDVYKALRQRFGLKEFRSHQEAAINATLSGKDVFVLLPTGGGKSLCFQLPAVVNSGVTCGVTIVVSPLLSLISDQTRALYSKDIPVVFLNSTMPAEDRRFVMSCLRASPPQACLAYVTPEQVCYLSLPLSWTRRPNR